MNGEQVRALNQALKSRSDSAAEVAAEIVSALKHDRHEAHIGFPERLFAWLNGVAPRLIDRGVAGKLSVVKRHAASR